MHKFANMNLIYQRYPLGYFLDSTVNVGLQAIELWAGEPHLYIPNLSYQDTKLLGKEIERRELELICFTPEQCEYPINLAASNVAIRQNSMEYFKKSIRVANTLKSPIVLVSAGYGLFTEKVEDLWNRAQESLNELAMFAQEQGVILVLEPFFYPYSNVVIDYNLHKRCCRIYMWIHKLEKKVFFIQERMSVIEEEREKAVLECLLDGMSMVAISRHMGLSRRHIYNLKE